MRADQAVVAGDPQQLPPTMFFVSAADGDGRRPTTETAQVDGALTEDIESILDVMSALLPAPYGTTTSPGTTAPATNASSPSRTRSRASTTGHSSHSPGAAAARCSPSLRALRPRAPSDRSSPAPPRSKPSSSWCSRTPTNGPSESLGRDHHGHQARRPDRRSAPPSAARHDPELDANSRVLRREPRRAVLRQEPRARPGRRTRRHHLHHRLRQERRRPDALPLRADQPRAASAASTSPSPGPEHG